MEGLTNIITYIIAIAVIVFYVATGWKIFVKAGKPGWAILIPIYNLIVYLKIVNKPLWWILLLLIPLVNIIIMILLLVEFLKAFDKPSWHVIPALLIGFIYFPILAFGKAEFKGVSG
jgi:hypothetical protein